MIAPVLGFILALSPLSFDDRHLMWAVNHERTERGLSLLPGNKALSAVAKWRSQDMCDRQYKSHAIPIRGSDRSYTGIPYHVGFGRWGQELTRRGIERRAGSENIGWISVGEPTPTMIRWWLNSPAHRAAMLDPAWTSIGAGYVTCRDGYTYLTTLFIR